MPTSRSRASGLPVAHADVEFLILADRAEVLNGKLYIMGGAWDHIFATSLEGAIPLHIACGVLIPYLETDDQHTLEVTFEDTDGTAVVPSFSLAFKTGRPPTLEKGAKMRLPLAFETQIKFPKFDAYTISATVDGRPDESAPCFLRARPPQPAYLVGLDKDALGCQSVVRLRQGEDRRSGTALMQ